MNHRNIVTLIVTIAGLLVTGCSSSPQAKFYTLNNLSEPVTTTTTDSSEIRIKIGPVTIPDTLDQPQIVTRNGSNMLNLAEFHRWGGNLQGEVERVLGENIATLMSVSHITLSQEITLLPIDYQVIVNIRELSGALGGTVTLNADWLIKPRGDKTIVAKKSVLQETASSPDYRDFVTAQSSLLAKLSREIAEAIQQQMTQP